MLHGNIILCNKSSLQLIFSHCMYFMIQSLHSTAVVLGFEMEQYTASETDGVVTLIVSVFAGSIVTPITIALSTINGSALGKSMILE